MEIFIEKVEQLLIISIKVLVSKILIFLIIKKFINWSKNKNKSLIFFLEIPSNPFLKIIDIWDIRKDLRMQK